MSENGITFKFVCFVSAEEIISVNNDTLTITKNSSDTLICSRLIEIK